MLPSDCNKGLEIKFARWKHLAIPQKNIDIMINLFSAWFGYVFYIAQKIS
jgi:hypothetical protein